MTETRTFLPIFEEEAIDPSRDCEPVGFMTFVRDEDCGDIEPELSLRFKIQDYDSSIEFSIGEEEVDSLIAALIAAREEFQAQLAYHLAGDPDDDEVTSVEDNS